MFFTKKLPPTLGIKQVSVVRIRKNKKIDVKKWTRV